MNTPSSQSHASELAALYLTGALSDDEARMVEARLADGDAELTKAIAGLSAAAESLLENVDPVEIDASVKAKLMQRIRTHREEPERAKNKINPVWRDWEICGESDLFTLRQGDGEWESTGVDGVEVRRLFVDRKSNRMTAMFRMAPGTAYPQHIHDDDEECYVLQGDLHVGDIVLHPGDYQRAKAGSHHGIQSTEGGCLLLVTSSLSDDHID